MGEGVLPRGGVSSGRSPGRDSGRWWVGALVGVEGLTWLQWPRGPRGPLPAAGARGRLPVSAELGSRGRRGTCPCGLLGGNAYLSWVESCPTLIPRSPDPGQPVAIGGRALQRRSGNMRAPGSLVARDWCPSHGEIGRRHPRGRREGRQEGTQGGGRLEVAWARSSLPVSSLATPGSGPQPPGRGMTVV